MKGGADLVAFVLQKPIRGDFTAEIFLPRPFVNHCRDAFELRADRAHIQEETCLLGIGAHGNDPSGPGLEDCRPAGVDRTVCFTYIPVPL